MILTDEKLSAFLDGELDTAEMDLVREAIAHDVTVSDRLAALAEVDRVVKVAEVSFLLLLRRIHLSRPP